MDAYIINGYRSAVGKSKKGGFRFYRPDDLAADVIKYLVANTPGLEPKLVDDLIVGNAVPEAEQGMQMGRMISLMALGIDVPGFVMNRYCGSGLEAIALAVGKIKAGMADCIIAGGTESMSLVPMMGYKTALNWKIASQHPSYYLSMGLTAEELAKDYSITREEADAFSVRSHEKALAAIAAGKFKDEIVPVEVEETYLDEKGRKKIRKFIVDMDEGPRAGTTMEALAALKLLSNLRWGRLCGRDVRAFDEIPWPRPYCAHDVLLRSRGGSAHHGHWTQRGGSQGAEAGRT